MEGKKLFVWKSYGFLSVGILMMAVVGCGTVQHKLNFNEGYKPQEGTKIGVGNVVNETGQTFDIDIEAMLKEAITEALQNEKLICTGSEGHKLVLSSKIINYKKAMHSKGG